VVESRFSCYLNMYPKKHHVLLYLTKETERE